MRREAETMVRAGHNVRILEWDRWNNLQKDEIANGIPIHRLNFKATYGLKIALYLPIYWCFLVYHLIKSDYDAIHAVNFDTYIASVFIAILRKKKLVYEIYDFYGELSSIKALNYVLSGLDRSLMKFADCVIIADESRVKQIGEHVNKNIITITNSPVDYLKNLKEVAVSVNEKNTKDFIVFFAGNLQKKRYLNMDKIIKSIKDTKNISLIIAGSGDLLSELRELCDKECPGKVTFLGDTPYDEVMKLTVKSDLLFSLYDPSIPNNKYASSNKLFEAMVCGKPILVSKDTSMEKIVRKFNCGIAVNCTDIDELRSAILTLQNDPGLCVQLGRNSRDAYEKAYSWEIMEDRLYMIYDKCRPQ